MSIAPDPEHHPRQLEYTDLDPDLPQALGQHQAGHHQLEPLAAGQPVLVGHQRAEAGQSSNAVHAKPGAVAGPELTPRAA